MAVFLLGSTDLTVAVAERIRELGIDVGAVAYVGECFDISYSSDPVTNVRFADVAGWCAAHGIDAYPYEDSAALARVVASGDYDLGIVAGWYHMVPRTVRQQFRVGCVGIHASLLPALRGGAPLNWALLSGARETGVTLFELDDGVDDGPVYGRRAFPIAPRATIAELVTLAEVATLALIEEVLPPLLEGELEPVPQSGVPSYGLQRTPEDGRIDWRRSVSEVDALVRAVGRPYAGARSELEGRDVYIWTADPAPPALSVFGSPGQIARLPEDQDPVVVAGDGALVLRDVTDAAGNSVLDELRRSANRRFAA